MSDQLPREKNFVHLHNHTEYSMLDGAARIDDMFSIAQEMGMPAIATTDHGYLFGAYEFWSKSRKYDVKPIIGLEAYVAPGTHRSDRTRVKWGDERTRPGDDVSGGGAYTHMTLLARNNQGMHNLFKMGSIASLDQVYAKWPRLDRELLSTYGDGLIATTGCPSGEVQTRIRLGQYDKALAAAAEFRDIFGAEHYFCELMDHGVEIERRRRFGLRRATQRRGETRRIDARHDALDHARRQRSDRQGGLALDGRAGRRLRRQTLVIRHDVIPAQRADNAGIPRNFRHPPVRTEAPNQPDAGRLPHLASASPPPRTARTPAPSAPPATAPARSSPATTATPADRPRGCAPPGVRPCRRPRRWHRTSPRAPAARRRRPRRPIRSVRRVPRPSCRPHDAAARPPRTLRMRPERLDDPSAAASSPGVAS